MDSAQIVLQRLPVTGRRLRIAMVTETYPPEVNGVAMTIGRMVAGLQARQHQIQLIRPRQHREDLPAQEPHFEEVLQRGVPIPRYDALKMGLPAKQALARLWSVRRPDIVHIVTEGPLGWSALAAARKLKLPVATDFHTNFHSYSRHYGVGWLKTPIIAYMRKFHNKALCTMVPTEGMRRELEQMGLDNLRVVARGVDVGLFSPQKRSARLRASWGAAPGDPVVLSVGRVAPEKNLALTLRAFDAMRAAHPRARLVVVGDGPERVALQARYPRHVFAGMRTGEDLAAHYASGDVFLFPSVTETYGNVTMEAMASGLAVVAYDYAAAAEHVEPGRNGLLAPLDDADEFIRLAAGLVGDHGRIERLGAAARATAGRLDWTHIVSDFERVLLELTAEDDADEPA
ncbi:MAG: glycosyltransferase family 1 protein [Burkholderiales bacterium]|nr:glycosyltransferase family 1 protein [Burkholderiales bacterium]